MIFDRTNRFLAARTSTLACQFTDIFVTILIRRTFAILLALDTLTNSLAVLDKSGLTRALGIMITSRALGITAAQIPTFACIFTFRPTVRVNDTVFVEQAIFIAAASDLLRTNIVLAELEVSTGRVIVARWLTDALQAQLIGETVTVRCADVAADARFANGTGRTLCINATVGDWNAAKYRITGGARMTCTHTDMILNSTA